jgi:hypothetical protein
MVARLDWDPADFGSVTYRGKAVKALVSLEVGAVATGESAYRRPGMIEILPEQPETASR